MMEMHFFPNTPTVKACLTSIPSPYALCLVNLEDPQEVSCWTAARSTISKLLSWPLGYICYTVLLRKSHKNEALWHLRPKARRRDCVLGWRRILDLWGDLLLPIVCKHPYSTEKCVSSTNWWQQTMIWGKIIYIFWSSVDTFTWNRQKTIS